MWIQTPYGGKDHGPRCQCTDCSAKFVEHNRHEVCNCGECAGYREGSPSTPPLTTDPDEVVRNHRLQAEKSRVEYERRWQTTHTTFPFPKPPERKPEVASIQMCDREGCECLIVKNAAGVLTLNPGALGHPDAGAQTNYTLCPQCQSDVDTMLHTSPISQRPRKVEKPYKGWTAEDDFAQSDAVALATPEQLAAELFRRLGASNKVLTAREERREDEEEYGD